MLQVPEIAVASFPAPECKQDVLSLAVVGCVERIVPGVPASLVNLNLRSMRCAVRIMSASTWAPY